MLRSHNGRCQVKFSQMSYLPVVWAGLFAYLGTSAGTCRVTAEGSRLCAKYAVSIARGVLPEHMHCCDATLNWGGYKKTAKSCGRLATGFLFSLVGSGL